MDAKYVGTMINMNDAGHGVKHSNAPKHRMRIVPVGYELRFIGVRYSKYGYGSNQQYYLTMSFLFQCLLERPEIEYTHEIIDIPFYPDETYSGAILECLLPRHIRNYCMAYIDEWIKQRSIIDLE